MPVIVGGLVYYLLGALWFSPFLFEKQWDRALGFERPAGWKPTMTYYLGPLVACFCVAFAIHLWAHMSHSTGWSMLAGIGFHVGVLVSLPVTWTNAISPKTRHPLRYAAVVGGYHALGATLAGAAMGLLL